MVINMSVKSYIKSLFGAEDLSDESFFDDLSPLPDRFGDFDYLPLGRSITQEFVKSIVSKSSKILFTNKLLDEKSFVMQVRTIFQSDMSDEDILSLTEESFVEAIIYGLLTNAETMNKINITPWTIELAKETANLTSLLGPVRNTLLIIVTVNGTNNYTHQCTEELICGILSISSSSNNFTFRMADIDDPSYLLHLEDLSPNEEITTNSRYTSLIIGDISRVYSSNTIDFIRGAITACQWLNLDPHKHIKDIKYSNKLLTF